MARRPSSVRLSVCPFVNFCAKSLLLAGKWRIATKLAHVDSRSACIQGVLKVKVKVKGHVICELSWILGMSYSVIDSLVSSIG